MKICFIDEAGDLGALSNPPQPNDQPVLVIGGLFVDEARLYNLTNDFLNLKRRFFPGLRYPPTKHLDRILPEIKGSMVRKNAMRGSRRTKKQAIGFLDGILRLLERYHIKMVARIWVKGIGLPFDSRPVYTSSIQAICTYFDHYLNDANDTGICIADSRNKFKNVNVAHSVFTQKFGAVPGYQSIVELPTFGHSDNHAGIQVCDIVCSGLLYPIACFAYCTGQVDNVHVQPDAVNLRQRYGQRLRDLQYRYQDPEIGRIQGGLVVSDLIGQQNGARMFRERRGQPVGAR